MTVLQEYKCPCCDGAIAFDAQLQKMKCPYCDTEFDVETLRAYDTDLNAQPQDHMAWDTSAGDEWQEGETEGLRVYSCNTCGGEIVADATTGARECPFCGNPVVMMGQFAGSLKPDLVIPFKVDKKAAIAALQNHYKGKILLPKVFKDENHIQEVKGLYVPVWLFDTDADAYGKHNDGILLLVSMDPREYRIHCRGMGSDAIGEGDLDAICEAVEAELSDDNYAEAFDVFAEKCAYYLDGHVNGFPFDFATNLVICLIIGLVVGVIGAFILKGQLKSVRKQAGANSYVKAGSMQINVHNDIYLYRDITRTKKESSSSSSDSGSSRKTGGGSF